MFIKDIHKGWNKILNMKIETIINIDILYSIQFWIDPFDTNKQI